MLVKMGLLCEKGGQKRPFSATLTASSYPLDLKAKSHEFTGRVPLEQSWYLHAALGGSIAS
jgi:hypothetical protein